MFAKKYLNYLLVMLSVLFLTGCPGQTKYITVTKHVGFELDKTLVKTVKEPTPPEKEKFISLPIVGQRDQLFYFSLELQQSVQMCNAQLHQVNQVYSKYVNRIDEMNKTSGK